MVLPIPSLPFSTWAAAMTAAWLEPRYFPQGVLPLDWGKPRPANPTEWMQNVTSHLPLYWVIRIKRMGNCNWFPGILFGHGAKDRKFENLDLDDREEVIRISACAVARALTHPAQKQRCWQRTRAGVAGTRTSILTVRSSISQQDLRQEGDENTGWFPLSVIRKLQRGQLSHSQHFPTLGIFGFFKSLWDFEQ